MVSYYVTAFTSSRVNGNGRFIRYGVRRVLRSNSWSTAQYNAAKFYKHLTWTEKVQWAPQVWPQLELHGSNTASLTFAITLIKPMAELQFRILCPGCIICLWTYVPNTHWWHQRYPKTSPMCFDHKVCSIPKPPRLSSPVARQASVASWTHMVRTCRPQTAASRTTGPFIGANQH